MATRAIHKLPGVLSFKRGHVISDGEMYSLMPDGTEVSVPVIRHGIRATQNVPEGKGGAADASAATGSRDPRNTQITESAKLDRAAEALRLAVDGMQLLGGIAINQLNRRQNFGNIGYWVRQSCQRQGIATRAAQSIAEYGFGQLKLTRLEIVAPEQNAPSRRVAEKMGAVFECIARNRVLVHGKPQPAAIYSLVPEQCGF